MRNPRTLTFQTTKTKTKIYIHTQRNLEEKQKKTPRGKIYSERTQKTLYKT